MNPNQDYMLQIIPDDKKTVPKQDTRSYCFYKKAAANVSPARVILVDTLRPP
jgi:hypothetical protein